MRSRKIHLPLVLLAAVIDELPNANRETRQK